MWRKPSATFAVRVRNNPIQGVRLPDSIDPGITYNNSFAEWEAAHAARLDLYDWDSGKYPVWFMAKVLAWHKLHNLVEAHTQAAVNAKAKADAKKKK